MANVYFGVVRPGLALAAALILLGLQAPAEAQVPIETVIAPPAANRGKAAPRRPTPEQVPLDDPSETPPPPPPVTGPEDGDEPTADGETRTERSILPTGGDLRDVGREPRGPVDGLIEDGVPTPVVVDGLADLNRDARQPRDTDAFATPPAGYDALAFQIEQIDPLNDRRTERLFRFEPYDPVGVRIGSFVIYPQVELGLLSNSNVYRSSNGGMDSAFDARGTVRAVSDWRAHAFELRAQAGTNFYDRFRTEDDRNWTLEARGRLDITRRANIEAAVSHLADKDIRATIDAPTDAARRGDVTTDRIAATYNQQIGRAVLQLRGSVSDVTYSDVPANNGTIISNAARNFTQGDQAVRLSWALNRQMAVFTDTAVRERDYAVAASDGIVRSSTSERYRVGLAFSPLSNFLRGEISLGWGHQGQKDPRLPDMQGLLVDASLAWKATAITTFLLTVRSDFYDTTVAGSPGSLSREAGLEVRQAFQRSLIGSAALRYGVSPYQGLSVEDRLLTGELGLDYYVNSNVSLFGRYQHLEFRSSDPTRDYTDDILRVGVRWRQ